MGLKGLKFLHTIMGDIKTVFNIRQFHNLAFAIAAVTGFANLIPITVSRPGYILMMGKNGM